MSVNLIDLSLDESQLTATDSLIPLIDIPPVQVSSDPFGSPVNTKNEQPLIQISEPTENLLELEDVFVTIKQEPIDHEIELNNNHIKNELAFEGVGNPLSPLIELNFGSEAIQSMSCHSLVNVSSSTEGSTISANDKVFRRTRIQSDPTAEECQKTVLDKVRSSSASDSPKYLSNRNKLLKLCLANASSPFLANVENNQFLTDEMKMEAARLSQHIKNMHLNESRTFDDSVEDLMSISPKWINDPGDTSDIDSESELEQMRIPMIDKLNIKTECDANLVDASNDKREEMGNLLQKIKNQSAEEEERKVLNDMDEMIDRIKLVVQDFRDSKKQEQANFLLENLSSLLRSNSEDNLTSNPPSMVRQGTFDVEKSDSNNMLMNESLGPEKTVRFDPALDYTSPKSTRSRKSQSWSMNEKPASVMKAIQNKKKAEAIVAANTPLRTPVSRRSSFSSTTTPLVRRSILSNDSPLLNKKKIDSPILKPKVHEAKPPVMKTLASRPPILNTKLRSKSGGIQKSPKKSGPLRAVPIKKVLPMMASRQLSSPVELQGI